MVSCHNHITEFNRLDGSEAKQVNCLDLALIALVRIIRESETIYSWIPNLNLRQFMSFTNCNDVCYIRGLFVLNVFIMSALP